MLSLALRNCTSGRAAFTRTMATITTLNPATGKELKTYTEHTEEEVDKKLSHAHEVYKEFRHTPIKDRADKMRAAARILLEDKHKLAEIAALEMGKTLTSAVAEVEKSALGCNYYADNAERFLEDEFIATKAKASFVRKLPIGVVLAIMPWNYPYWQVFRFAAPALMAGNVGVLKHANNVTGCAIAIEDVFRRAGFPVGAFQTLVVSVPRVRAVIDHPHVMAASLTGSEFAGMEVASACGRNIKKTLLELGGSDPFIVMPSADVKAAIAAAVNARCVNNGQSCIAGKRFIVHEKVYDEFRDGFVAALKKLKIGDPMDPATEIGPLSSQKARNDLITQVKGMMASGARVLCGAEALPGDGFYVSPGVLEGVPRTAPGFYQELFGPVAMLFKVSSPKEALELANDTTFGLGSSVWTVDEGERDLFVNGLDTGMTYVNSMVVSEPALPFGGQKRSGYGRELSYHGLYEFCNLKTVYVAK
mmetsp:Transcript_27886/g.69932  ORF Transcript_27886/g.69932 Transcript_27886/m.69932 type:complete len:476 (-) Transcript_27886:17-1444(-)